ncbi:MAG TPA: prephenate dehydrogenase/arogenate dehydrogenase family protein [Gemmataceae bacterium]|jgi:prephenate dehydrogenase|nr:prephenate dehydrogenase/arogenate dehydrogenase family protein [Gemmataceae bacterium]
MLFDSLTVVGVGLIGGSVALAAKAQVATRHVVGVGRNADTLEQARSLGIVDEFTTDLAAGVRDADMVVFCSPVDQIARQIRSAAGAAKAGALLTDAGSTKGTIVRDLDGKLPNHVHFVGAHPLAGSEKQGAENARADLFDGRVCVVTPTANTDPAAIERVSLFWQALGCVVKRLTPEEHDLALATTSHLPHLIASLLAGQLPSKWHEFAATGFRDTTRVAAGDPGLWKAIARENALALSLMLDQFSDRLNELRAAILDENGDALIDILSAGKRVRDALGS